MLKLGQKGRTRVAVPLQRLLAQQVPSAFVSSFFRWAKSEKKIWTLPAAIVLILAAGLLCNGCGKKKKPPPSPPQVQTVTVSPTNVPIYAEWVGSLEGLVNADIRAQVTGYLQTQHYAEGSHVKKGELLFEIDPRPFQAALDQTKAKLAQDEAQQVRTELDVKRYTPLAKVNAISQQELDNAIQANLAAKAQVKLDQAAIESAQLNLGFTRIISPIDGLAGVALAQIGDLVGPSGTILTTVSTIDPIRAYFYVSELAYLTYRREYTNALERQTFEKELELRLILADGSFYSFPGRFYFSGREISQTTGTLLLAGLFPNPQGTLRPGQFVRVQARTETRKGALLVPQRAVTELQGAYQVAIVDNTSAVHIRPVKVGERVGSNWIIDHGLESGDRVIVEGTDKVKEGAKVNPRPFAGTKNESAKGDTNR